MICRCVIFGGRPGYVPVREGDLIRYVPCPDCGGRCEGDQPTHDIKKRPTQTPARLQGEINDKPSPPL